MSCRCSERKAAIVGAVKRPSTALTAAKFVVKTGAQDITSKVNDVVKRLQRRVTRG